MYKASSECYIIQQIQTLWKLDIADGKWNRMLLLRDACSGA